MHEPVSLPDAKPAPAAGNMLDPMLAELSTLPSWLESVQRHAPALEPFLHFCWHLGQRWTRDKCTFMAAAMAFFGLLSLFPIMLAAVAILGKTLMNNHELLARFEQFMERFFPGDTRTIVLQIDNIAARANTTALGIVAIASLLWSGRAYFNTLAIVLNSIWPNTRPRSFWGSQLALSGIFLGAGALWLLSTGAVLLLAAARAASAQMPDYFINLHPMVWTFITRVVSWILTTAMFWTIYRFLPNIQTRQRERITWTAACFAGLAWEVAKFIYARFVGRLSHFQFTYGGLAGVVSTMMWIYVSSLILLAGAEAAAAFEEISALNLPRKRKKSN